MATFESLHAAVQPWQNFYLMLGGASATLIGLMFVSVTFGSSLVTKETAQTSRAFLDPSYLHFLQVFLTAALMVIPAIEAPLLGGLLLAVSGLRLIGLRVVFRQYRETHRRNGDVELSDWLLAIILPLICQVGIAATAIGFFQRAAAAIPWLAVFVLCLLLIGIHSAWELLCWMALAISEKQRNGGKGPG